MEDKPIQDMHLLEAIEACRPGSNDLSDPALAFLATELAARAELDDAYERLQRLDAILAEVFDDVAVPEGLQDRILCRLAATASPRQDAADDRQRVAPSPAAAARAGRRRVFRWGWLVAGGVAAASVMIAISVWRQPGWGESFVRESAIDSFNADWENRNWPAGGQLVSQKSPPEKWPLSPDVLESSQTRWRWVSGFLGRRAVAYDMTDSAGRPATLYVVRYKAANVRNTAPPARPVTHTAFRCTSLWQQGELLYVLVFEGDSRTYQDLLVSRGPVT